MRLPSKPEATSCFRFDGSTSYISSTYKPSGSFSFSTWVFTAIRQGGNNRIVDFGESGPIKGFNIYMASGRTRLFYTAYNDTTSVAAISTNDLTPNTWNHILCTSDGTNHNLYVNGVLAGTATGAMTFSTTAGLVIGRSIAASGYFHGLMYDVRVYNRILTAQEAQDLADAKEISSTSLALRWIGNQNGGATVPDASGNGNDGTFTTPFYVRDSPFYPVRSNVGGNLVYNGDFEIYPKNDNVATTTTSRWIDGTNGTSSVDMHACGWGLSSSGTLSAQFDTTIKYSGSASLKLSTLATGSFAQARLYRGDGSLTLYRQFLIPCRPSTSYTLTYQMKTNYVSGDSSDGAYVSVNDRNSAGTALNTFSGTKIKTTTDWTLYTVTFTTGATAMWLDVVPLVYGHTGTATLIMDAWFDDIVLTETTPVTRNTATGRLAVRDMGTSLRFTGSTSDRVALPITLPTDAFTISFWDKPRSPMGDSLNLFHGVGSFSLFKQGVNDMQVYAYLNAPNDFATPRRLRFRNFTFPGTTNINNVQRGFRPEWEHRVYVVYVENGSGKCDEYVNGVKIGATHTVDYTADTTTPNGILNIGSLTSGSLSANIFIDEPRIWNRALSATEVADLYQNGLSRGSILASGLVGEWLFDEGSGSTAYDTSGSDNHGTITGATYSTDVACVGRSVA